MIRLHLGVGDVLRTRFGVSPLVEVVLSLYKLISPRSRAGPPTPWRTSAIRKVQELDLSPLAAVLRHQGIAEFLTQPSPAANPTLAEQLDQLCATETELVRADVSRLWCDELSGTAASYLRDPAGMVGRLAETLHRYWDTTIADQWKVMEAVLHRDVRYRTELLAAGGLHAVLSDLNPRVRLSGNAAAAGATIEVNMPGRLEVAGDGGGLVLVPSAFCGADGALVTERSWPGQVFGYRSRGLGQLGGGEGGGLDGIPDLPDLTVIVSKRRAQLLYLLRSPATPTELARLLGVTVSAVSQQLSWLTTAGLLTRDQVGRKAFYRLTTTGSTVVELFDHPTL